MGVFGSVKTVVSEIWNNKVRLFRLAKYELKSQHGGTFFGFLWKNRAENSNTKIGAVNCKIMALAAVVSLLATA